MLPSGSLLLSFLILVTSLWSIVIFFVRGRRWGRIRVLSFRILIVSSSLSRSITDVDHLILINVDVNLNQDRLVCVVMRIGLLVSGSLASLACALMVEVSLKIPQGRSIDADFRGLAILHFFSAELVEVKREHIWVLSIFVSQMFTANGYQGRPTRFVGLSAVSETNLYYGCFGLYCFRRIHFLSPTSL